MENRKLKLDFEMSIFDVVDLNKSFAAAKCLVCYTGRNRNYSDIGRQKIIDALPSLKNIPVVGRYDVDKNDFGSHDIKIVDTEDGIDIVNATIPFGVVPESANQWFETRLVNGEEKECFFTDLILWKRQHGYEHIVKAGTLSESMEIDVSEYVIDQDGYCIVDKFQFEALCLLGDAVEPCFENACVQMYSKEILSDFKLQFSEMLREFKELNQSSTTEVDIKNSNGGNSTMADESKKNVVEEVTESVVENTADETIQEIVTEAVETDKEDTNNTTETDNESEVDTSNDDFSVQYAELKEKYDILEKEYCEYKAEHSFLDSDFNVLKEYKESKEREERKTAEDALFANYENVIGETKEFAELKKNSGKFSLKALKKECLCIVGMYSVTNQTTEEKKPEPLKFSLGNEEHEDEPYGGLIKHYLNR